MKKYLILIILLICFPVIEAEKEMQVFDASKVEQYLIVQNNDFQKMLKIRDDKIYNDIDTKYEDFKKDIKGEFNFWMLKGCLMFLGSFLIVWSFVSLTLYFLIKRQNK